MSSAYGNNKIEQGLEYVVYIDPGPVIRVHPPAIGDTLLLGSELGGKYTVKYDFTDRDSFQNYCELAVSSDCATWSLGDALSFINNAWQGKLLIPNNRDEYTIKVKASKTDATSNNGDFGIFFDLAVNSDGSNDSGYIFQFDRGMGEGQFVLRPRDEGREGNRIVSFASRNIAAIPTKDEDSEWWSSPRDVQIKLSNIDNNRRYAQFYIDDILIGDSTCDKTLDPDKQYYSGLRGWQCLWVGSVHYYL